MGFSTVTAEGNKITAEENMILTNGETYGKTVYLGKNSRIENWREITVREYEKILKKQEEKQ